VKWRAGEDDLRTFLDSLLAAARATDLVKMNI